jgi:hypothetical protein
VYEVSIATQIADIDLRFHLGKSMAMFEHFKSEFFFAADLQSVEDALRAAGFAVSSEDKYLRVNSIFLDTLTGDLRSFLVELGRFALPGSFVKLIHEGGDYSLFVYDGELAHVFGVIPSMIETPKATEARKQNERQLAQMIHTALDTDMDAKLDDIHYWRKAALGMAQRIVWIAYELGCLKSINKKRASEISRACDAASGYLSGRGYSLSRKDILEFDVKRDDLREKLTQLVMKIDSVPR